MIEIRPCNVQHEGHNCNGCGRWAKTIEDAGIKAELKPHELKFLRISNEGYGICVRLCVDCCKEMRARLSEVTRA